MSIMMEIECGTHTLTKFEIDIEVYGCERAWTVDPKDSKRAYDLLRKTMDDITFIDDGHRNDDAVNCCTALHVLGYDPVEWFENFFDTENQDSKFFETDVDKFMDHVRRVCGDTIDQPVNYPHRWGPVGDEAHALNYSI